MEQRQRLDRELIGEPRLWRLAMRIGEKSLHVILLSTIEDNSLIYSEIPIDSANTDRLKALEEAVYENPLLLVALIVLSKPKNSLLPHQSLNLLKSGRE